jgi:SPP1 family predicted phage head-tail adaptor
MGLKAGDLRDRVTIQEPVTSINSSGEQVTNWEEVTFSARGDGKFWASVNPMSARELLAAEAVKSEVKSRVVMRYNANVTAKMRLLIDGVPHNIAGIIRDPETGMEWMTLPVSAGLNVG